MRPPVLMLATGAALVAGAFAAVPAAASAAPVASGPGAPVATARMLECRSSLDQAARTLVVEGRMRTVPAARRLQMRFELQTRAGERAGWSRVPAPDVGGWESADPAPRRYVFDKRIERLNAPAEYRMIVRFRWLGPGGQTLASARRVSATCIQEDLRPDLRPERIRVAATRLPGVSRYVVPVRNTGRSAAETFAVGLTVAGVVLPPVSLQGGLAPGQRSAVVFEGPACLPGSVLVARADPGAVIEEREEGDNEFARPCPNG